MNENTAQAARKARAKWEAQETLARRQAVNEVFIGTGWQDTGNKEGGKSREPAACVPKPNDEHASRAQSEGDHDAG